MYIENKFIANDSPTFIVAEIGANHNGDVELAKRAVDAAAECGVDAVKFQTYTAEELVADVERIVTWGPAGRQVSEPVGEMFNRIALPREKHKEVFDYAKRQGLIAFSTPFSIEGVDFLSHLDVPCYKVASSDVNYHALLIRLAQTGKPIMLSLGKCTLGEADDAISLLWDNKCKDLVIMHCVANYPSQMEDMNLNVIKSLKNMYPHCVLGFSDHSLGITASIGAVAFGARVIEKHFTLDKKMIGPDHWFSMDPSDMQNLVTEIRNLEIAMGHPHKRILKSEQAGRDNSIRSLVLAADVKEGRILKRSDLKAVRPGGGVSPAEIDKVIGLKVMTDLSKNTVLKWDHFKSGV